jgi:hypothetical protein
VIRHPIIKAIIDQCIGNVDSSSEDLVQMSTQLVGDGVRVECTGEIEEVEFAIEVGDVVIKVTTYHNRSIRILPYDVFDDVCHPHRSFLLELLFPWFEVAIQQLHLTVSSLHPHPTKVGAECFHQGQSHFRGSRNPTPPIPLQHGLM